MKKKIIRFLSIILPLLLGVFLIIYNYRQFTPQQLDKMYSYFKNADYMYVYLSLFIALTGYISRAYRWRYTLGCMGYNPPFATNFFAVCISYFMNMTIPRSGEVSRALVLTKYEGVPFDKAFGTIISERVVDLLLLIVCVTGTMILQYDVLSEYVKANVPLEKLLFYGCIAGALFIGAVLMYIYSRSKFIARLKIKVAGLMQGITSVFTMSHKWPFLLHSVYIWVSYVLMFYVAIFSLPETAGISFGVVAAAFVTGSLATTFTNSGFGVFPVVIGAILHLYNVPLEAGTAFGWIVWTSQMAVIVCLGGLSFLLLPLLHKNK